MDDVKTRKLISSPGSFIRINRYADKVSVKTPRGCIQGGEIGSLRLTKKSLGD
jgi:hypothetical protein